MRIPTALDTEFADAVARIKHLSGLDAETQVDLYALYMQSTSGDAAIHPPPITGELERAKYIAWAKRRHTPTWVAKRAYIDRVNELIRQR